MKTKFVEKLRHFWACCAGCFKRDKAAENRADAASAQQQQQQDQQQQRQQKAGA